MDNGLVAFFADRVCKRAPADIAGIDPAQMLFGKLDRVHYILGGGAGYIAFKIRMIGRNMQRHFGIDLSHGFGQFRDLRLAVIEPWNQEIGHFHVHALFICLFDSV